MTGSGDRTAKVWDMETGREFLTMKGHTSDVLSVAFSPDGKRVVTGSEDKTAKVWDMETGRELQTLKGHASSVTSVAFSPDGKRVVTGSEDKTAKVWDMETGRELLTLRFDSRVDSVAFSNDGLNLLVCQDEQATIFPALDWTKTPEELEKEKLERWQKLWQETYGDKAK